MARDMIFSGERRARVIKEKFEEYLKKEAPLAKIDYVEIADTRELKPLEVVEGEVLLATAVRFPEARLIDNLILNPDEGYVLNDKI
jgi:pantoate--beta-alanine ligase